MTYRNWLHRLPTATLGLLDLDRETFANYLDTPWPVAVRYSNVGRLSRRWKSEPKDDFYEELYRAVTTRRPGL